MGRGHNGMIEREKINREKKKQKKREKSYCVYLFAFSSFSRDRLERREEHFEGRTTICETDRLSSFPLFTLTYQPFSVDSLHHTLSHSSCLEISRRLLTLSACATERTATDQGMRVGRSLGVDQRRGEGRKGFRSSYKGIHYLPPHITHAYKLSKLGPNGKILSRIKKRLTE